LRFAGCVLAILLAGAAIAFAQGNGVITGTVVDKDGVVPGATITATDTATGIVRKAVSDDRGVFRLLSVPPGRYRINVEVEGFKTITVDDFPLLLGESRDLGKLAMTVGALTESLTVTAEVTPVQTSGEPAAAHRHRRSADDDPGQGSRHLRHDEDPCRVSSTRPRAAISRSGAPAAG
jgi:hypothetical protein